MASKINGSKQATTVTIFSLPDTVLLLIIDRLHVKDLLALTSTHSNFYGLVNAYSRSIWEKVSYRDTWPGTRTLRHFQQGADNYNLEALVKLALAGIHVTYDDNGDTWPELYTHDVINNASKIGQLLLKIESIVSRMSVSSTSVSRGGGGGGYCRVVEPFTWTLIRPPWANPSTNVKRCILNSLIFNSMYLTTPSLNVSIAKALHESDIDGLYQIGIAKYLADAARDGSIVAKYMIWENKYGRDIEKIASVKINVKNDGDNPLYHETVAVRELRDIVASTATSAPSSYTKVTVTLCRLYASGRTGSIPTGEAVRFVRNVIRSSRPVDLHRVYGRCVDMRERHRKIVAGWMVDVELAYPSIVTSEILHTAIVMMDRFVEARPDIDLDDYQLLAIASLVICARFFSKGNDVLSIGAVIDLAEGAYTYQGCVKMIGEIMSDLNGRLFGDRITLLEYLELIGTVIISSSSSSSLFYRQQLHHQQHHQHRVTMYLAQYFCELVLVDGDDAYCDNSTGLIASAAIFLARTVTMYRDGGGCGGVFQPVSWTDRLVAYTGFSLQDVSKAGFDIYKNYLSMSGKRRNFHADARTRTLLYFVIEKYSQEEFLEVAKTVEVIPSMFLVNNILRIIDLN